MHTQKYLSMAIRFACLPMIIYGAVEIDTYQMFIMLCKMNVIMEIF